MSQRVLRVAAARRLAVLLLLAFSVPLPARADCAAEYQLAAVAVYRMQAPQTTHRQLADALADARRMTRSRLHPLTDAAVQRIDSVTPLMSTATASSQTAVSTALAELTACLQAPRPTPVPLSVRIFTADGAPAAAGVAIRVDGEDVATTGADGTAVVQVPPGEHELVAVASVNSGNAQPITVEAAANAPVDLTLDSGDFSRQGDARLAAMLDGVVPSSFSTFPARLIDAAGNILPMAQLLSLRIDSAGATREVAAQLAADGTLAVTDPAALRTWLLDQYGPFDFHLRAADAAGEVYSASLRFDMGRHHLSGIVGAPAGVILTGVVVRLSNQRNGLTFWATISGNTFAVADALPEGPYTIAVETASANVGYHDYAAVNLDADKSVQLSLHPFGDPVTASSTSSAPSAHR